jgi:hypothetical protein
MEIWKYLETVDDPAHNYIPTEGRAGKFVTWLFSLAKPAKS